MRSNALMAVTAPSGRPQPLRRQPGVPLMRRSKRPNLATGEPGPGDGRPAASASTHPEGLREGTNGHVSSLDQKLAEPLEPLGLTILRPHTRRQSHPSKLVSNVRGNRAYAPGDSIRPIDRYFT